MRERFVIYDYVIRIESSESEWNEMIWRPGANMNFFETNQDRFVASLIGYVLIIEYLVGLYHDT